MSSSIGIADPAGAAACPSSDDAPSPSAGDRRPAGRARHAGPLHRAGAALGALALALSLSGCATGDTRPRHAALDAAAAGAAGELAHELAAGAAGVDAGRVAVLPARAASPELAELAGDLRHRLGDHLRAAAPDLVLVERDDLDALWREHRLSATGLLDPGAVAELGRVLGADALLLGSLVEVDAVPQLHLRLVDVETAAVLASASRPLAGARRASGEAGGAKRREDGRDGQNGLGAAADDVAGRDAGSPLPRPSAPSLPGRPVVGDFRLALDGCAFVSTQLVCRLTAANLAPGERFLTLLGETTLHDTSGDDYRLQRVRIGTAVSELASREGIVRHRVPGGLQVSVELTFSGVPRRKRKAQLLDVRFAEGRWAVADIALGRD